ncbi:SseB family protein [Propionibacteriaceae bacterium Y1700]|uniref:SseB family protein n=1 Tax=Microlunatus sp. Y1700 TaxID=3418487 RepID=UPI003DA79D04
MDHQRTLSPSPFPGDDGLADPAVRRDLAGAMTGDVQDYLRAVASLCRARLMVPVVATATSTAAAQQHAGVDALLTVDKEADMAVVMLQAADGRKALLGFTGLDSLTTWQADARPVPVTLDLAARSAVAEQATALIIDMQGPHPLVIDGEVLEHLAAGHRLVELPPEPELEGGGFGWVVQEPESDSDQVDQESGTD